MCRALKSTMPSRFALSAAIKNRLNSQNPENVSPAPAVSAGISTEGTSTVSAQLWTDPSPIRKLIELEWPVENHATPGGGPGGDAHCPGPTPTATVLRTLSASAVLPKTRLL